MNIADRLMQIRQKIDSIKQGCSRTADSIELLAVSKAQPIDKIKAAISAGQKKFGENYLQEALTKINVLSEAMVEWHFIGAIQRNKTKNIAENFTWVHSIASKEIAKRLSEQRPVDLGPLHVCLQINLCGEPQKSGILPIETISLAKYVNTLPNIVLRGIMTIPPFIEDFSAQRQVFRQMRKLKDELANQGIYLDTLSMGMSHDFEAAILEGATIVRIGSAIFGDIPFMDEF